MNKIIRIKKAVYDELLSKGRVDASYVENPKAWRRTLYTIGYSPVETAANMAAVSIDLEDGLHLVNLEIAEENSESLLVEQVVPEAKKVIEEYFTENGVPQI